MDLSTCAVISLGGASPLCSMQPTRDWPNPQEGRARMEASSLPSSTDEIVPAWPCSRRGLPGHVHYCARRWSLTPPFHHHPAKRGAVCFCGPFPAGSCLAAIFPSTNDGLPRPGCYPTPCSIGVRTFLDPVNAGPRLPDQPEAYSSYLWCRGESIPKGGHFRKRH